MFNQKNLQKVALFVQPTLVGYVSSVLGDHIAGVNTIKSKVFTAMKNKFYLTPPGYVFPIMWGILYVLIGYAAYRVFDNNKVAARKALVWNQIQLLFNFLWPIVYFGFGAPRWALLILVLLFGSVLMMLKHYKEADKIAFYVILPYVFWLGFAGYLNAVAAIYI